MAAPDRLGTRSPQRLAPPMSEQIDLFNPEPLRCWWTCGVCGEHESAVVIEECWRGPMHRHDLYRCSCGHISQATRLLEVQP
jgi:hypothetical protein